MAGYQVLARRWRPQRFEDLVGQDVVVRTLRNALTSGQIGHAYLFSGLRGVGKTTVARLLAKALNCDQGPTPEPCGTCVACQDITNGSSMDVLELDAASNRGIDDVRELREVARVLPVRDRYRVFILDEAHQLSKDAFAALLKILEEPPAHVVFILASTEKDKFPATILSRCLQVDFRPIPADLVAARLLDVASAEGFAVSTAASQMLARAGEGSLRDALSLLDRVHAFCGGDVDEDAVAAILGLPPFDVVLTLWHALAAGEVADALAVVEREQHAGRDPVALYEQVVQLLHALLLLSCDADAPSTLPAEQVEGLRTEARRLGTPLLLRLLGLAMEQRNLLAGADHPAIAAAVVVGRLALWPRLVRVEALLTGQATLDESPAAPPTPAQPARRTAGNAPVATQPGPPVTAGASPRERLLAALEEDAPTMAGRVRGASDVVVDGEVLRLRFTGVPAATLKTLRDCLGQVKSAAERAGLPSTIEVEDTAAPANGAPTLRQQVESDEAVRRVLQVFGGRIESAEERS
ncbi:MAG: DNA polymerase III subunit gamma/tau [Thermoanaerobaculaceae bacterium]|jgi:DNA polymerase-3 subunit gamma/tau|nr:DNA polymerase III subunit gamma/tau [Thermoanaerobaculaceae bacterium]